MPDTNIREHSFEDEKTNIGIDFDGVIHKNSKGYYDGTIYDDPIDGSYEALETISKNYDIIIYTVKAKKDRQKVDGKTGTELVWEWLKQHNMDQFVKDITSDKPRAVAYIDDKGIRFENWSDTLEHLKLINLL
jgi:hypothetical protein